MVQTGDSSIEIRNELRNVKVESLFFFRLLDGSLEGLGVQWTLVDVYKTFVTNLIKILN